MHISNSRGTMTANTSPNGKVWQDTQQSQHSTRRRPFQHLGYWQSAEVDTGFLKQDRVISTFHPHSRHTRMGINIGSRGTQGRSITESITKSITNDTTRHATSPRGETSRVAYNLSVTHLVFHLHRFIIETARKTQNPFTRTILIGARCGVFH